MRAAKLLPQARSFPGTRFPSIVERFQHLTVLWGNSVHTGLGRVFGRVIVAQLRGADFYRQRAEDMRRQAERAISPHLRETYLRIAVDWERMADEVRAKEAALRRTGGMESGT